MQGPAGPARFWPIVRKLSLGAGIALGVGIILYSIGDIVLIGDFFGQLNAGFPQFYGLTLFAVFMFLLFGTSVIRVSLAYSKERLRGGRIMSTAVIGSVYLIVQGAALMSLANQLGASTSIGTTITNNGILLIASGILIIVAGALLLQSNQTSRIAGGVIAIVAAGLLTDLIYAQGSATTLLSSVSSSNLPAIYTTLALQSLSRLPGVTGSFTLSTPGYFLASYWAEIGALIVGAVGLLAWSVLQNRKEAKYAAAIGGAALFIYAVGLAVYGFQTSTTILGAAGSVSTSNLTGYPSRLLSESQIVGWSLLIAGIGGILALIASGFGIALTAVGARPLMVQQQSVAVPVGAMGGAFCRKCGAQARLGDTNCRSCGAALA